MIFRDYQIQAIKQLQNGSILCGGVGSGKSITALGYYILRDCYGGIKTENQKDRDLILSSWFPMERPRDLYIITTAKKRDSLEWEKECANLLLGKDSDSNFYGVNVTADSWNNIKKYKDVHSSFFIFDEQRVVGNGVWVKTFLNITRKNHWILLSATPGDQWSDYIPVFVANGFYKNKTEFSCRHCVYARFSKYPKIERYVNEKTLERNLDQILVVMKDERHTVRHEIPVIVGYNKDLYKMIFRDRWNPYDDKPIQETGKLLYLMRQVLNEDSSRLAELKKILKFHPKIILFYNFTYELHLLREVLESWGWEYTEWNGEKHEELPFGEKWVYLVQYSAGCEGWNCITTDTIVFYSQNYSYRMTEQAAGRIDRVNTPYVDLYYYYFRSNAPLDLAIHKALKNKKKFNERSFLRGV